MNCLRCGRALKNKRSIDRGYGPGCDKKIKLAEIKDTADHAAELEQLDGQLNILEEIRMCS